VIDCSVSVVTEIILYSKLSPSSGRYMGCEDVVFR
jgi:hypothetical protein